MATISVLDAIEKLSRTFAQQPDKACSKNAAAAVLESGLRFQVCNATMIAMRAAQLAVTLTSLEVSVASESDTRGMLGTDDRISAGLLGLRTHVKIAAADATADPLQP